MRRPILSLALLLALLAGGSDAGTLSLIGAGPGSGAPACADASWGSVKLLVGNDSAANGSTTFIDQSGAAHTVSIGAGSPTYSNTTAPSGLTTSINIPSFARLSSANSADWQLGSGDWTIELYANVAVVSQTRAYVTTMANTSNVDEVLLSSGIQSSGKITAGFSGTDVGGTWSVITSGAELTVTDNTWAHVAWYRSGNNFYASVGGTVANIGTSAVAGVNTANALTIGSVADGSWSAPNLYIGALRVTKGVARYGPSNFTTPSLPLPNC